jgi:hypothetical protein
MTTTASLQIFNVLPEDGTFITGKQLRELLPSLSYTDLKTGKAELRAAGQVVVGRGRGGKIARAEGVAAPEAPKKLSKEESLERARQEKEHLSREQKRQEQRRERAQAIAVFVANERNIDLDRVKVDFTGQEESPLVYIWDREIDPPTAIAHRVDDEVLLREGLV